MTDVIIPTCKPAESLAGMVSEIRRTAGCPVNVIVTGLAESASSNRNVGLDQAVSDPIIMVDDDMEQFPQGWVTRMVEVMNDYPACQMASARLMSPSGELGVMTGRPDPNGTGCEILAGRELCTACIVIRNTGLRFDENYIGSGFEDNDFCRQLVGQFPDAQFICIHDLKIVHRNEMKNQHGAFWNHNKAYYLRKWFAGRNK